MKLEKGFEISLIALIKVTEVKGEDPIEKQEDDDKDIGHGGGEIGL